MSHESNSKHQIPNHKNVALGSTDGTARRGVTERNDEREKRMKTRKVNDDQYTFAGFATSVLNIEPTKSATRVELIATTLKGMLASTMGTGTIAASV